MRCAAISPNAPIALIATLKQGVEASAGTQYVTIRTSDLAWLVQLVESLRTSPVRIPDTAELN